MDDRRPDAPTGNDDAAEGGHHDVRHYDLAGVHVDLADGVATVTIDHPPLNLFDVTLITTFDSLGQWLEADDRVSAIIIESADPDFWIAHADVAMILELPRDPAGRNDGSLHMFHRMVERFRTMPKATIAKITGVVRGGGAELAASMDMRFVTPQARLGQPEVGLGILPGGSGTERLAQLVGRSRALEIVLGCADVDGTTAAEWGWVNRCLPASEIDGFVADLARRIADSPPLAVAEAKASVLRGLPDPTQALLAEAAAFDRTLADPAAIGRMERFLELGGQTREVERDLASVLARLGDEAPVDRAATPPTRDGGRRARD